MVGAACKKWAPGCASWATFLQTQEEAGRLPPPKSLVAGARSLDRLFSQAATSGRPAPSDDEEEPSHLHSEDASQPASQRARHWLAPSNELAPGCLLGAWASFNSLSSRPLAATNNTTNDREEDDGEKVGPRQPTNASFTPALAMAIIERAPWPRSRFIA